MKNLNAIVWLYRGEIDKYQKLLGGYRTALGSDNFDEVLSQLTAKTEQVKAESKSALETCAKRDKKATQAKYDEMLSTLAEQTEIAKQALWLTEKFGNGEYKDVLGLCKLAKCEEIKEKGFSLTPGAYVGVEEVADDGVDFSARMKEIHEELLALQAQSNDLMSTISKNIKELGL